MAKILRGGEFVRIRAIIPGEGRGVEGRVLPDCPAYSPGDVVSIMTHGGVANALLSEVSVVADPPEDFVPMYRRLPYGRWRTAEGGDVLFDRGYQADLRTLALRIGPGLRARRGDRAALSAGRDVLRRHERALAFGGKRGPLRGGSRIVKGRSAPGRPLSRGPSMSTRKQSQPDPAALDVLFGTIRSRLGNDYVIDGSKLLGDPMSDPDIRSSAEAVAGFAFDEIVWQDKRAQRVFETETMRRWPAAGSWRLETVEGGWLRIVAA